MRRAPIGCFSRWARPIGIERAVWKVAYAVRPNLDTLGRLMAHLLNRIASIRVIR
jgi:hypothetical protein